MLVTFTSTDEVIVGALVEEERIIKEYFAEHCHRNIDDYERVETRDLRINASVDIHTY